MKYNKKTVYFKKSFFVKFRIKRNELRKKQKQTKNEMMKSLYFKYFSQ